MKKYLLIMLLGALTIAVSCSSNEAAPSNQTLAIHKKAAPARVKKLSGCIDMNKLELSCTSSSSAINSPVTFTWNNSDLTYTFNRSYQSYIQIESNDCEGANAQPLSIPVHAFSDSFHTLAKGRSETCFKYRLVILGADKGESACEAISPWQEFSYIKAEEVMDTIPAAPVLNI